MRSEAASLYSLDAEMSVLGGILLRPEVLGGLTLEIDDMYSPKNQSVLQAMRNLECTGRPIDIVTVEAELARLGTTEAVGGMTYLLELSLCVPSRENVVEYASVVERYARRRLALRKLLDLADRIRRHEDADGEDVIMEAINELKRLDLREQDPTRALGDLMMDEIRSIERDMAEVDRGHRVGFIPSGIDALDALTGGIPLGVVTMVLGETGHGKCLGIDTPVMKFDGSVVQVQSVAVGDMLMGPDGQPRTVLSTNQGHGELFRIDPIKGESWVCNDVHVMTLVDTVTSDIVDIPLDRLLASHGAFRHRRKLFTVGIDRFNYEGQTTVDPYFLGLWFGDGTKEIDKHGSLRCVAVTKPDVEVLEACRQVAAAWGVQVRVYTPDDQCPTYTLVNDRGAGNPLLQAMRGLLPPDLSMPAAYLRGPRAVRLQFLAGLLDSDGDLSQNCFSFTQKREDWARATYWLARSLGFCSTIASRVGRCKLADGSVFEGTYWRLGINGDLDQIPTRIPRKHAAPRRQKKTATRTGFSVGAIGPGDYYGFTLDGDGRFLLGDFTVTHNSTLGMTFARNAYRLAGDEALVLSYEDSVQGYAKRGLAQESGVPTTVIGRRAFRPGDQQIVTTAGMNAISTRRERFVRLRGKSIEDSCRLVRRLRMRGPTRGGRSIARLVVFDYFQRIPQPRERWIDSRVGGLEHIAHCLEDLAAGEHDADPIAVVALAQMNDEASKRSNHRPVDRDCDGGRALPKAAKLGLGIYRPFKYGESKDATGGEIVVFKQNEGEAHRTAPIRMDLQTHTIRDVEDP